MSGVANNEAIRRVNSEYGGQPYTVPLNHSMSLHTGDPGTTDAPAAEAVGGTYARQTITFGAGVAASPSGGQTPSNIAVTFSGMPAGVYTHAVIWNGAVATNATNTPQISFPLASSVTLAAGQGVTFASGAVTIKQA